MAIRESTTPFISPNVQVPIEEDRRRVFLIDTFTSVIDSLNAKEIGIYYPQEVLNGEEWFMPNNPKKQRDGYRTVVPFPALPNITTLTLPHNIPNIEIGFTITHLYCTASNFATNPGAPRVNRGDYFQIAGDGDSRLKLYMDNVNVYLTSTIDLSAYTGIVVIEYVKEAT